MRWEVTKIVHGDSILETRPGMDAHTQVERAGERSWKHKGVQQPNLKWAADMSIHK